MDVFISWSGKASQIVGLALKDWLPSVIQSIEPFISSEDIAKGSRWFSEIGDRLEKSNFGIICLTPDNYKEPWILFETGAISKSLGESCVAPILLGMTISELEGPIAQFNATLANKGDMLKLIKSINEKTDTDKEKKVDVQKLERIFEALWPELEVKINECISLVRGDAKVTSKSKIKRSTEDILEELIDLGRSNIRLLSDLPNILIKELSLPTIDDVSKMNRKRLRFALGRRDFLEEQYKRLMVEKSHLHQVIEILKGKLADEGPEAGDSERKNHLIMELGRNQTELAAISQQASILESEMAQTLVVS